MAFLSVQQLHSWLVLSGSSLFWNNYHCLSISQPVSADELVPQSPLLLSSWCSSTACCVTSNWTGWWREIFLVKERSPKWWRWEELHWMPIGLAVTETIATLHRVYKCNQEEKRNNLKELLTVLQYACWSLHLCQWGECMQEGGSRLVSKGSQPQALLTGFISQPCCLKTCLSPGPPQNLPFR